MMSFNGGGSGDLYQIENLIEGGRLLGRLMDEKGIDLIMTRGIICTLADM